MSERVIAAHNALLRAAPLVGARSLSDGPTSSELRLIARMAEALQAPLHRTYRVLMDNIGSLPDSPAQDDIARWAYRLLQNANLDDALRGVLRQYIVRAGELGIQLGLLEMGVTGVTANLTDQAIIARLAAVAAALADFDGEMSLQQTTAREFSLKVFRLLEEVDAAEIPARLRPWAIERVLNRSSLIADTEVVRGTRDLLPTVYRRNGIAEMQYYTQDDGDVCPICEPYHRTLWPTSGRGHPAIPLHGRCRCFYEPAGDWTAPETGSVWYGQHVDE